MNNCEKHRRRPQLISFFCLRIFRKAKAVEEWTILSKELLEEAKKSASEAVMQKADAMKSQIDSFKKLHHVDFGGEEVCEVCGLRYPLVKEGVSTSFEHVEGRIHKG